jgi:hypothetical protein
VRDYVRARKRRIGWPVAGGLPVGARVLGRRGHDADVVAAARELERAFGGCLDPERCPTFRDARLASETRSGHACSARRLRSSARIKG